MDKTIGVIVTSYNGEKYIEEQIDSICKQSVKPDKIYIFDDKSTDETCQIIKQYFEKHPFNHELIINSEQKGWKKNFIDAFDYVDEDYVFIADQDDIWLNNKVEIMLDIMTKNNQINLLTSNYHLLYSCDCPTKEKNAEVRRLSKNGKLQKISKKKSKFYVRQPGCTFCVRNSFMKYAKNFWNEDLPHDALLWQVALVDGSLYSMNCPLIYWRRHSSNETNKKRESFTNRQKRIDSDYIFSSELLKKYPDSYVKCVQKYFKARKKMFESRSLFIWILIFIKYRKFYVSLKSCLGDLYYILKGK